MNTIQAAIAEIVAEALRDAANALIAAQPETRTTVSHAKVDAARFIRERADRVAAGLTP